jgi:hypothetical protein
MELGGYQINKLKYQDNKKEDIWGNEQLLTTSPNIWAEGVTVLTTAVLDTDFPSLEMIFMELPISSPGLQNFDPKTLDTRPISSLPWIQVKVIVNVQCRIKENYMTVQ